MDSIGAANSRYKRTQVVPMESENYFVRFRATNNKSLTVPVAKIVKYLPEDEGVSALIRVVLEVGRAGLLMPPEMIDLDKCVAGCRLFLGCMSVNS